MIDPRISRLTSEIKREVYAQSMEYLAAGDDDGLRQVWEDFSNDERIVLWSLFNSWERKAMRAYGL